MTLQEFEKLLHKNGKLNEDSMKSIIKSSKEFDKKIKKILSVL